MDLLNEWNNMNKEVIANSETELAGETQVIKTESADLLSLIKKNMRMKLIWGRALSVPALIGCIFTEAPLKYWLLTFFLVYELLRFLMLRQLKGINYEVNYTEPTKYVLEEQLEIIKKTLQIERIWGYFVVPAAGPVGYVIGQLIFGKPLTLVLESLISSYLLLVLLLLGIPLIYLAEKMNKYAFGKYIDKLTAHLKEIRA